jgi:serine/threonine-protein phosphatase 2B catalytic subunit
MDVFQWSLPFVAEKVTDMLAGVLEAGDEDDDNPPAAVEDPKVLEVRGGLLKKKVVAVSKLLKMYKLLRQENEAIVQLKQLTASSRMPVGLLADGPQAIQKLLDGFESAKNTDLLNEQRPSPDGKVRRLGQPPSPVMTRKPRTLLDKGDAMPFSLH